MATEERTQRPLGSATIISRRRFLEQTAFATAVVSVPYLAGGSAALGKEKAKVADAALDLALKRLVAMEGGPPGVIAVIQRGQHRKVHTFGVANVRTGRPMRIHDRMRIASTSKAFSGAVALSLVSKGALSLNDTIGELLSELPKPPPDAWTEVTLHDPSLLFDPGSKYQYSNSDNIAVALMVEAATGTSYEDQLREQFYRPLGLRKTTLPRGPNLRKPFIHGYDNDPSQQTPEDLSEDFAAGWAWASGGMVSTPADLNDFIRGYVGGKLFDKRTQAKQRRVIEGGSSEPPGPGKNSAGLAIFRYQTRCGTVWGHTGNFLGYTQFAAASADGRRSVTVSINAQHTLVSGSLAVFEALRRAEGKAVCAALAGS
jgi:D-alanyl-D-alanine carboxypeptidase